MNITRILIATSAALLWGSMALAQGTATDYRRAFNLRERFSPSKVYYSDVRPTWIGQTHHFWYVRHTPQGNVYVSVDADRCRRDTLFDHHRLASALTRASGRTADPKALTLDGLRVSEGLDTLRFVYNNHRWTYAIGPDRLTDEGRLPAPQPRKHWMETDDEKTAPPALSPDGRRTAYVKDCNVYVRDLATGREQALTTDGTQGNYYSAYIRWSPDSRRVATCKIRPAMKRYVYYVESSPADQLQPRLHKQEYAKPGDELPHRLPCIFEVETKRAIVPSDSLFARQYALTGLQWNADGEAITFEYNQRGHQVYRVLELSALTGRVRTLIEETSDKYVNYVRHFRHDLADGRHIIWMSERDNWEHLYMVDRTGQTPPRQITRGKWYVRQVQRVDEANRLIYFSANGMHPDEDPYLIRYYRIGFDGRGLTCLTPDEGMHHATYSADMAYLVDVHSLTDRAPVADLRRSGDGRSVMHLETADISLLEAAGWRPPETFVAKGRDGVTDMWGIIIRPTNFDPSLRYPIIEYIYQGPGDQYVPKDFRPYDGYMSALAELGFIVVMVDGMGTSFRSRTFENICHKNLKDAGLPDHMAWIRAAAAKYPYMDIDRVGIYGCSAGGQESTNALLLYPDFYKAAYSACGCHDNRMDKIWWNELWMGYPVDESYAESSNVVNAHLLRRPLMLVVGEMDDNVDPASTMQLVNALIRAGKDFELVVIPGARHTMGESFGEHKRFDFFVRHLLHREPPTWDELR